MDTESPGTPVEIHLETHITQNDNVSSYVFDLNGQVIKMGNAVYIRYMEDDNKNGHPVPVTMKINNEGNIRLTRSGENKMQMYFAEGKRIEARYRTPYGILPIETETPNLNVQYRDLPFRGNIKIDYNLLVGAKLLGQYKIRLQFTS
ncbi:hypothetical protein WR164_12020 [Philodulcilactobacillus myokoensis]|uniref:DUF1934 domain-containing protein n=1 Tax=Philodulcilactobacillus myokoensis TaxID=2929573 RepID=A0A9W6B223_9LACO|nr:DUF1934 domain-containing protein [Philodulcilactobacillus myokoensis]GLB47223.1 hypothetical protein WR164_12020 [Philodulcilactobacillus myokoensis]